MASFASNAAITARLKEDIGLDHRNGLEYASGAGGGKYREDNDYRLIRSAATAAGAGQPVFSTPDYSAHPPPSSRLREDFRSSSSASDLVGGKNDFSASLRPPPIPFSSSAGAGAGGAAGYVQHFWNYGGGGGGGKR